MRRLGRFLCPLGHHSLRGQRRGPGITGSADTLSNINPNLTVNNFRSLDYQVAGNFTQERLITRLTALFGLLALVLASVGLYGITAYSVARRTSEIGLRMALGANRGNVVALVLRGASSQVALGLVIGIPAALLGGRLMANQLYGVRIYDPFTLTAAVFLLSIFAGIAAYSGPACRYRGTDEGSALRVRRTDQSKQWLSGGRSPTAFSPNEIQGW